MATRTLTQLRDMVREHADQETIAPTLAFVETDELDKRINEALSAFRDLLIELEWMEWLTIETHTITLAADTSSYPLPTSPAFQHLLGVRGRRGSVERQLQPWHYQERAPLMQGGIANSVLSLRYRLNGPNIVFLPTPKAAATVYLDYIPEYSPLVNVNDPTFAMPYGWWKWAVLYAALDLVAKEGIAQVASGSSLLAEKFAAEDKRIRAAAAQRDSGIAPRIIDRIGDYEARDAVLNGDLGIGVGILVGD